MRLREENADSIDVFLYCPSAAIAFLRRKGAGKRRAGSLPFYGVLLRDLR